MPKTLKIAFTGSAVMTPAYPTALGPVAGPLTALMPGARRVRRSTFRDQINAQFAFLLFPYRHLIVEAPQDRDADYKYPDIKNVTTGLCFFEREELRLVNSPIETGLTFDQSPATGFPTTDSHGAGWIARWEDFAAGGNSRINPGVLDAEGEYVRVVLPAGEVSAGFVGDPIARINFDYGQDSPTRPYAQEIVVKLTFDDSATDVTLSSAPFAGGSADPSLITFRWYDASEIKVLFGNGSLASIQNVLNGSFVGQDHEGDFDLEFEVLYDIVQCADDHLHRLPLPQIRSSEILRVPCIASMITSSGAESVDVSSTITTDERREPRESRRNNGGDRG